MYQALYRKWRPRTFDDVVGQSHITDTLKRQVATGRLSHAYLFTGTRGTGKTSCAKILARAVNCEHPVDGNPCNRCPSCLGIENGSILDVLELDAASNNGVDQVRALRDEAVYTPAAVRRRVYIIDEVHMLSTAAFNALLKILEEPPDHLMFILATTELNKVLPTIRSRCQQFAFKRIAAGDIARRLSHVAEQEGIQLSPDGAVLLARLADGGLRDALSLLDQCMVPDGMIGEAEILDALGMAGDLETAALMEQIAAGDTAAALETLARLYRAGKDVGGLLGELAGLARDLLVRRTAPRGGTALLTGGYDETTMRRLSERLDAQRLMQMLSLLQSTIAGLGQSPDRRTAAELCLIRLSDVTLDASPAGLSARLARLEEQLAGGVPALSAVPVPAAQVPTAPVETVPVQPARQSQRARRPVSRPAPAPVEPKQTPMTADRAPFPTDADVPPWEEERPPLPEEPGGPVRDEPPSQPVRPAERPRAAAQVRPASAPARKEAPVEASPAQASGGSGDLWPAVIAAARSIGGPGFAAFLPQLTDPAKVEGRLDGDHIVLWCADEMTKGLMSLPQVGASLTKAASGVTGRTIQCVVKEGKAPPEETAAVPASVPAPSETAPDHDALDDLLAAGERYDSIIIK
ncbi:DNA polymerase III subunit gamma/tau [Pseudoflavonifractor sp. MSJ-37]|uniref:DNA polymerase III subunit gamma/tau n=1 Tax=Pseudoflavonifractor sp. MSJ-37 TaxID=2841531 RepID=UPI001C107D3F|nr:DNA polymerase III subunit gamma/tau [Pseudoflavonifractor sp. MSJ-37]MBU5434426.1 DNA polymerase III subunit gamma/tau [Pseudoflavonifractor sp. MSJ-37]